MNRILQYLLPTDASYVRSGAFSTKTANEINEVVGLPPERLVFKHAPGTEWDRYLLVRFNINDVKGKRALVHVELMSAGSLEETDVHYEVRPIEYDGKLRELTYDTMPVMGEAISCANLGGFGGCDVTEYIEKLKKEGKSEVCFAIVADKYTDMELRLTDPTVKGKDVCIIDLEYNEPFTYFPNLSEDEKENAEIWAWAQKLYDEWRERYEDELNKQPLEAEMIESPEEQYTESVWFSSSSKNFESSKREAKTRLFASLDDIDELVPRTDYPVDEFGGLMDESRRREATGFFRIEKIGKRFWVIDPKGYPCVIRALSQVLPNYQGSEYQMACTLKKYGSLENWGEVISNRLKNDLHFFASASPDSHVTESSNPIVSQRSVGFAYAYGRTIGTANSKGGSSTFSENNTMNVFDPGFVEFADTVAKPIAANKDNPNILGYTTDNELPMQSNMLLSYLSLDPYKAVNRYSYACAWTWFKNMSGKEFPTDADIKREYYELFRGFVWDRYYNVVTAAMRKYDPNHMLLGTRFLTGVRNAEWVLKFASRYLDCMTINWYFAWQPQAESIYLIAKSANCPFMITEFYTKAGDSGLGNTSGAGQFVQTQKDRGMFYQNYILRLLEATNCIGWHWFQYLDNDPRNAVMPDGRIRDVSSTDSNKGIVSNEHEEYTECTKYMAEINRNAYRIIDYFDKKYGRV